jgi:hypothetical protein
MKIKSPAAVPQLVAYFMRHENATRAKEEDKGRTSAILGRFGD